MRDYQTSVKIVIQWDMNKFLWVLIILLFEIYNKYKQIFCMHDSFWPIVRNHYKKPGDKIYFVGVQKTSSFLFTYWFIIILKF